jgi:hypothetical protein
MLAGGGLGSWLQAGRRKRGRMPSDLRESTAQRAVLFIRKHYLPIHMFHFLFRVNLLQRAQCSPEGKAGCGHLASRPFTTLLTAWNPRESRHHVVMAVGALWTILSDDWEIAQPSGAFLGKVSALALELSPRLWLFSLLSAHDCW